MGRKEVPSRMNYTWIRRLLSTATLTVLALSLSAASQAQSIKKFKLSPSTVTGGSNAEGWALLDSKAPTGGAQLTLSSDQAFAQVPQTVTVPAGESRVSFSITTSAVTADSVANLTATDGAGNSLTAPLTVKAPIVLALKSVGLEPGKVASGKSAHGSIHLNGEAPTGGFAVSLSFDQPFAHAPASVTVPAGEREAKFSVTTDAGQSGNTTLTATDGSGNTATAPLSVYAFTVGLRGLELHPDHVLAGNSTMGHVRLNGQAPSGGLTITLSSDQSFAHPDATVTVAAGSNSADFNIATDAGSSGTANISATDGTNTFSASLKVKAPPVLDVKLVGAGDGPYIGGSSFNGFVVLNGAAPTGGFNVTLSSDNTALQPPAQVTVPAGQNYVTFSITSSAVTASTAVTLTATDANSVTVTRKVTLLPASGLKRLRLTPDHVAGGSSATGVLSLFGAAPDGGLTFTLTSDSTSAVVPSTVTVAAGATSATFTITTSAVTALTKVTLTATDSSGNTKTATLYLQVSARP